MILCSYQAIVLHGDITWGIKNFRIKKSIVSILIVFSMLAVDFTVIFPLHCYAKTDNEDNYDVAIYYENGHSLKYSDVGDELLAQFLTEYENISASESKWIKSTNAPNEYSLVFYADGSYYNISKYTGSHECYIEINGNYFDTSDTLDELIDALIDSDATLYMEPDEYLLTYTTETSEPQTDEEYISAAEDITIQWLEYLKTTDGEYNIKSYDFNKNFSSQESRLLADGYVNGLREWVVEVRFNVDGIPDDSVFYNDTGYNTYYSYYFGPMVILRLRWQDGVCSVVDYDDAYIGAMYGGSLLDNLYGIRTSDSSDANLYPTFYEFMNDSESRSAYLDNGIYNGFVSDIISHNVLMLSNGSIYYVDIGGSSSYGELSYSNSVYTGKFARQFYDETGNSTYSSPITYDDATQSPTTLSFHEDFSLIFDDYNSDGNPDYTIKTDEDEDGSTYYVSCMSNDGTPRANPYNAEVYLANYFDDSVRLQRYEDGYISWYRSGGKLTASTKLDDYRMYSQRYYEPEGINAYETGTENIICYLWNNTDTALFLGSSYGIEKYDNGEWVSIANGLDISDADIINDSYNVNAVTGSGDANAEQSEKNSNSGTGQNIGNKVLSDIELPEYSHLALSFDVSSVTNASLNEYRIALELENGQTVYGGFYMGDGSSSDEADNNGANSYNGSSSATDDGWYHFEDNPPVSKDKSGGAVLTLENKISTKETASDVYPKSFCVLKNGNWESLYCNIEFADDYDIYNYYRDIPYGETASVQIPAYEYSNSATPYSLHRYVFYGNMIDSLCQAVSRLSGDSAAGKLSATLYTAYFALELLKSRYLTSYTGTGLPKDGDVCRLEIGVGDYSEFVYFTY